MSGTHRDLQFCFISRCFACKTNRWGLRTVETRNYGANHAVSHAHNDRSCLGPTETCYSGQKVAVMHAKNHRWGLGSIECSVPDDRHAVLHAQNDRWCLGAIETCYSGPEVAVLHEEKNTDEGCNPERLVILVIITLFCMHKTTGDVWEP